MATALSTIKFTGNDYDKEKERDKEKPGNDTTK
jgi:hypothetical protein